MDKSQKYFWAKTTEDGMPGCDVLQHCKATAEVAKQLLELMPNLKEIMPEGVVPLVGVHDVGKISPGFQTKCAMWKGPDGNTSDEVLYEWKMFYDKNHAWMSQSILRDYYREIKKCKRNRFWASCVGAHHGSSMDNYVPIGRTDMPEEWKNVCVELIQTIEEEYGPLPEGGKGTETLKRVVCGFMTISDWIASNEACFPTTAEQNYENYAKLVLKMIGFHNVCEGWNHVASWAELFNCCNNPRPIQKYLWQHEHQKGIYIIEDLMGGGKTEAALGFAYHMIKEKKARGIYFALPTQTTSNRIFVRVKDFLRSCGVEIDAKHMQLAHGSSWLLRDSLYDGEYQGPRKGERSDLEKWFTSSKRSLLAPFGVGTIDQALMGVVAVKHRDVRAFALAEKVVILDEVHSYDFYTGSLISTLVKQLNELNATVIILSATLTKKRIAELLDVDATLLTTDAYPLVTSFVDSAVTQHEFEALSTKTVYLDYGEYDVDDVARMAYERACKGECVLWIRNTVSDAQEAYKVLKSESMEGGPQIGLLHARFPYWRREELEEKWIDRLGRNADSRPEGCVLVSTQIVEQSVDIDADFLITDLAPIDMILQRTGRLWRHERKERPCKRADVLINLPLAFEAAIESDNVVELKRVCGATAKVYAPYVLLRTWFVLKNRKNLTFPSDIRELIEQTYDFTNAFSGMIWETTLKELNAKKSQMESLAKLNQDFSAGVGKDDERCFTRYGEVEACDVLLLRNRPIELQNGKCKYEPLMGNSIEVDPCLWQFEIAKTISYNIVKVPKYMLGGVLPDSKLEKYGINGVYPFFVLESGELKYYTGDSSSLFWNLDSGVSATKSTKPAKNEESEFMY